MENTSPAAAAPSAHTKQYVFVDEYNRHKRLKVMRACDGCRKRKIRCDGAVQNGPWPCGACIRLKLKCIPPTLDQDDEQQAPDSVTSHQQFSFQNTTFPSSGLVETKPPVVMPQSHLVHEWASSGPPALPNSAATSNVYAHPSYQRMPGSAPRLESAYSDDEYFASTISPTSYDQGGPTRSFIRGDTVASGSSSGDTQEIESSVRELSSQMGDLQIDITSAAPYITNPKQLTADAPAIEEAEVVLPASVLTDSTVRIPPEMMPSEERALDYFGYFFDHIHSYCPVLNRAAFYRQWRTARSTISPLLLEAIFACVARYLEQPVESRKWLALASRHEEGFKDIPRLSTIQAMIILMKARESIAKRGYYYRSWMDTKYMITMGFDLGLHEHCDQHRAGASCRLNKQDCMQRTRIWQCLFVLEILVGAPQGRTDFSVEVDSVQVDLPVSSNDVDAFEHLSSRRSSFMAQSVRNIKITNVLWQTIRRYKKDWALDPEFVRHNEDLPRWLKNLPADFQIQYPDDGSPPWLGGNHFVADLHCYHHLVVIMHHRPQLQALLEQGNPDFRIQLDICLVSAVLMCRIQEALHRDFGFHGLQFMIRGVNFTIYCVLTCTMLHLAAITSPDPLLNSQARLYFTRHMRVLEHCLESSTPEMRVQINALREAFSANTRLPFELKPTLGLRSPTMDNHSTPSSTHSGPTSAPAFNVPAWSDAVDQTPVKRMPANNEFDPSFGSEVGRAMNRPNIAYPSNGYDLTANTPCPPHSLSQVSSRSQIGYALEPVISNEQHTPVWDPSGIFQQWNAAFGGAPPPQATPPSSRAMAPTSAPMIPNQQSPGSAHVAYGSQSLPVNASSVAQNTTPTMPTVTPVMWQNAFTNAYVSGHGQKRYREASVDHSALDQFALTNKRRA